MSDFMDHHVGNRAEATHSRVYDCNRRVRFVSGCTKRTSETNVRVATRCCGSPSNVIGVDVLTRRWLRAGRNTESDTRVRIRILPCIKGSLDSVPLLGCRESGWIYYDCNACSFRPGCAVSP